MPEESSHENLIMFKLLLDNETRFYSMKHANSLFDFLDKSHVTGWWSTANYS